MAKPPKIELPADLNVAYSPPDGVTRAEIQAMVAQVAKDADALLGDKNTNVEGATWLLDAVDVLNARDGELAAADQAQQDAVNAARDRLNASKPKGEADAEGDEPNEDDEPTKDGDEPTPAGGQGAAGDGGATDAAVDAGAGAPVLVASSAVVQRRSAIAAAASEGGNKPTNLPKATARTASLVAAAEVKGFAAGQTLDWPQIGRAAESRFRQLPQPGRGGPQVTLPFGQIKVESDEGLVASAGSGDFAQVDAAIDWALSGKRLEKETGETSLLAAGGWCAPSETLYDLVNVTTRDGLLDIAGITVNRGGVRFSLGPNYAAVYNGGQNFTKTEAQAIAGSAKPVVNIPCPSFTDHRMVVDGMYLTGDILSQKGYPEAYADFIEKSGTAFAHYVNAQTIADMEGLSTQVDMTQAASTPPFFENPSAATELLGAVELQVTDMRYRNRLSLTNSVEVVLPLWVKGVIRSDLSKRANVANPANISDADIEAFFTQRSAMVQWVYDWQDAFTGVAAGFGAATPIKAWPTSVKFLIYPAGTFVRALSDVIELNAVYDSVLLQTNQYVALFMEQARLTMLRGWDAREITCRVKVTGATGAPFDYTAAQPTV